MSQLGQMVGIKYKSRYQMFEKLSKVLDTNINPIRGIFYSGAGVQPLPPELLIVANALKDKINK